MPNGFKRIQVFSNTSPSRENSTAIRGNRTRDLARTQVYIRLRRHIISHNRLLHSTQMWKFQRTNALTLWPYAPSAGIRALVRVSLSVFYVECSVGKNWLITFNDGSAFVQLQRVCLTCSQNKSTPNRNKPAAIDRCSSVIRRSVNDELVTTGL